MILADSGRLCGPDWSLRLEIDMHDGAIVLNLDWFFIVQYTPYT
jgi:hypothetical protein